MNQNEQMRKALQKVAALRGNVYESESKAQMQALIDAFMACERALAAEPEPLVRLTEEEIDALREVHLQHQQIESYHEYEFARAIMDAMIAKNGGKP